MADPVYDDEKWWGWQSILDSLGGVHQDFNQGLNDFLQINIEGIDALTGTQKNLEEVRKRQADRLRLKAQAEADLNPGPGYQGIWGDAERPYSGETYKPVNASGRAVAGPFSPRAGSTPSQQSTTPTEAPATEEDYLNQLLMASLMKGRKPTYGRQAPSSYGVGATVPFGDAWRMRRTIGGQ